MRGLTLWGDVQRGRWDAPAKGWSGMCGISGDKPDASLCTTEYVLPNTFLLYKTQCSQARPCTSSPLSAACVLSVQKGWGMKGKGLGELKGGGTREGKGKFALSHNFYQRVFGCNRESWVTQTQQKLAVRQTDRQLGRQER